MSNKLYRIVRSGVKKKIVLRIIRFVVPCCLILFVMYCYVQGFFSWYSLATLQEYALQLRAWVLSHILIATILFFAWYSTIISACIPGGALSTIAAGYVFGWVAVPLVLMSSLVGATGVFILARTIAHPWLNHLFGQRLHNLHALVEKHGARILLVLRLIPVIPFFLLNILGGLTHMSYTSFIGATFLGIVPGIILFVAAGQQLSTLQHVSDVFSTPVLILFGAVIGMLVLPMLTPYLPKRFLYWISK